MTLAARLDQTIKAAGVPILGVSISDDANRATWLVYPADLQAAAQPIIAAFVLPTPAQLADEDAQRDTNRKELQAVAVALWECITAPTLTKAQLKNRIVAIYKALP